MRCGRAAPGPAPGAAQSPQRCKQLPVVYGVGARRDELRTWLQPQEATHHPARFLLPRGAVGAMQRSRLPAGVRFSPHLAGDADKSFGPCSLGDDAHGQAKRLNPPVKGTSPSSSPPCLARAFSLQISPSLPPGSSNGPGRRALMHIPINRV